MRYVLLYSGFTKLHIGLVALVKKMSVLINFLLQNYQSCVSPLQTFATHVWQDGQILRTLIIINYIQSFASKSTHDQPIYLSIYLSIALESTSS